MDWSLAVAVVSAVVAVAGWATSARKTRVDNLCQIIDAQQGRIEDLEQALEKANGRITELETENRRYRQLLTENDIDPDGEDDGSRH